MTTADNKQLAQNQILAKSTVTMVDGTTHTLYDIALGVTADSTTTTSPTNPTTGTPTLPVTPKPKVQTLAATVTDTNAPSDSLTSPLDNKPANVGAAHTSDGPTGEVMTAEPAVQAPASGNWLDSQGQDLSNAINVFNSMAETAGKTGKPPVAQNNDAAMVARHLYLRQAIAAFTVKGPAPAIFARQGSLDGQATLAAAVKPVTKTVSGLASVAA
jgi:hypothetical protein